MAKTKSDFAETKSDLAKHAFKNAKRELGVRWRVLKNGSCCTEINNFKARAEMIGGNYQTLMNDALKQFAQGLKLSDVVREAIHETWETCLTTHSTGRGKKHRGT